MACSEITSASISVAVDGSERPASAVSFDPVQTNELAVQARFAPLPARRMTTGAVYPAMGIRMPPPTQSMARVPTIARGFRKYAATLTPACRLRGCVVQQRDQANAHVSAPGSVAHDGEEVVASMHVNGKGCAYCPRRARLANRTASSAALNSAFALLTHSTRSETGSLS